MSELLPTDRILAQDVYVSNDTWQTRINNNDLIIGPTGSGKTRYYVKPNLLQMNESFVVTDTKGSLRHEIGPTLKAHGYEVIDLDFAAMTSDYGYNPFDFIGKSKIKDGPDQQHIMRVATAMVPIEDTRDLFWDLAARNFLASLIGYILEALPKEEQNIISLTKLLSNVNPSENDSLGRTERALDTFSYANPESFTAQKWLPFKATTHASRMYASILGILSEKLDVFTFDNVREMQTAKKRVDFASLGTHKTAVFITVSDTDRSMDKLVSLFYSQALQELCESADTQYDDHALPVPVRLYLDDFATNCRIDKFDGIISVIRSRNIAVSVVLQSITQLDAIYSHAAATTILNGCDHILYLGGQDIDTADFISKKANRALENVLGMDIDEVWLFERGKEAQNVKLFDLTTHPHYQETLEFDPSIVIEEELEAESFEEILEDTEDLEEALRAYDTDIDLDFEHIRFLRANRSKLDDLLDGMHPYSESSSKHISDANESILGKIFRNREDKLYLLAGIAASCALTGNASSGGPEGLINPNVTLTRLVKSGNLDDLRMDEYNKLLAVSEEVSLLWDNEATQPATVIAKNALLYALTEDQKLFDKVYKKAKKYLSRQSDTMRKMHGAYELHY